MSDALFPGSNVSTNLICEHTDVIPLKARTQANLSRSEVDFLPDRNFSSRVIPEPIIVILKVRVVGQVVT